MECTAIASYNASSDNELTFKQGEILTLLDQNTTGKGRVLSLCTWSEYFFSHFSKLPSVRTLAHTEPCTSTGWALALKTQGEKESGKRSMGYVPCSYLKQIPDGNEFENTAELEEDCLGFVSSLAARKEKEWLSTYGNFCGLPTPCSLSLPPTHNLPAPIPKHQPRQYTNTTSPSSDHKHPFSSRPTHTHTELSSHPPQHRPPSRHILSPTRKALDPHSSPPPAHHSSLSGHVPFIAK